MAYAPLELRGMVQDEPRRANESDDAYLKRLMHEFSVDEGHRKSLLGAIRDEEERQRARPPNRQDAQRAPLFGGRRGSGRKAGIKDLRAAERNFLREFHSKNSALLGALENAALNGDRDGVLDYKRRLDDQLHRQMADTRHPLYNVKGQSGASRGVRQSTQAQYDDLVGRIIGRATTNAEPPQETSIPPPTRNSEPRRRTSTKKDNPSSDPYQRFSAHGHRAVRRARRLGIQYDAAKSPEENLERVDDAQRRQQKKRRKNLLNYVQGDQQDGVSARLKRRQGPIGHFVAILGLLNRQTRILTVLSLVIGVLFVPVGIVTFSGWALAALVMTVISAIYWILVNALKVIASAILAAGNFFFSFVGSTIVATAEGILFLIGTSAIDCPGVPEPSRFCSGRQIVSEGLIPASSLNAFDVDLIDPDQFRPKPSSKPVIQWILERWDIGDVDLGHVYARTLGPRFESFLATENVWVVVSIFATPLLLLGFLAWTKWLRPLLQRHGVH